MTSAEKRINALRVALKYSSGADRNAIRALILETECGFTRSPALSQAAPESEALEEALVAPTSRDGKETPTPQACREDEDHRTLPARPCALRGCGKPFSPRPVRPRRDVALYCSRECANEARRRQARGRGTIRGAQAVAAQSARARAVDAPPVEAPAEAIVEPRQQPSARPRFTLTWNSRIVIQPDAPAFLHPSVPGYQVLFRDDLNARADHGSPGQPLRPDESWRSPTASALAGAIWR